MFKSQIISNFNGQVSSGSITTPGFPFSMLQGIGLIETMLCQNGTIRFIEAHHKRLIKGLKTLGLNHSLWTLTFLEAELHKTISGLTTDSLRLRLQTGPDENGKLWWLIQAKPVLLSQDPIQLIFAERALCYTQPFSFLKSADRQCYFLASQEAKTKGKPDALLLNQYGRVVESTMANLFWVKEGQLYTPPLSEGCVEGIFRQQLITRKEVTEASLSPNELLQADEVFLSNAVRGIIAVEKIEKRQFSTSQISRLQQETQGWH